MIYEDITPEQIQKAKALQTPEELLAFAKQESYELSEEDLNAIGAGQDFWDRNPDSNPKCPLHCPHV